MRCVLRIPAGADFNVRNVAAATTASGIRPNSGCSAIAPTGGDIADLFGGPQPMLMSMICAPRSAFVTWMPRAIGGRIGPAICHRNGIDFPLMIRAAAGISPYCGVCAFDESFPIRPCRHPLPCKTAEWRSRHTSHGACDDQMLLREMRTDMHSARGEKGGPPFYAQRTHGMETLKTGLLFAMRPKISAAEGRVGGRDECEQTTAARAQPQRRKIVEKSDQARG